MTRFCEILPLWLNFKSAWQSFEGLFSNWVNFEDVLGNNFANEQIFIVSNGQISANNLAIWSHTGRRHMKGPDPNPISQVVKIGSSHT